MIYVILFILSVLLTYSIRAYTRATMILDVPNERSSHTVPVPKGGGLAIIIIFYIGLIYFSQNMETKLIYALLSALPIVIVSLLDDIFTVPSKIRFFVQSISACSALYFLGGVNSVDLVFFELHGWWLNIIAFIGIIWLTNLYNFLDGIDGYAGAEAVTVGLGLLFLFHDPMGGVIVSASLGFLFFNWHKASIFMGDVGSATLGFLFSVFILNDTTHGNIYSWLVLLSLFWFDATVTLIRRYMNREKLSQAHRKHAYQRLTQVDFTHGQVASVLFFFNMFFLGLLYVVENKIVVFLFNLLSMIILMKYVDQKKRFV